VILTPLIIEKDTESSFKQEEPGLKRL